MPGQASGGGQQVRGIIARSKGAPVAQVTVVVLENADRAGIRA